MGKKIFKRRVKSDKPVLAIFYDLDKTLSPDDIQAQGRLVVTREKLAEHGSKVSLFRQFY